MKVKKTIFAALIVCSVICCRKEGRLKVQDQLDPLPPAAVRLDGYLDRTIRLSMENWNKGAVPYAEFVDFFRNGRPQFALGEMWGKAVRSGCMFY
ncbi:MAG: hypothetical protein LBL07_14085 [Tannerella sp.]|jgi:hypothetical protein|nr:hypothetical protein [Tannerella sp.]